jgi:hypothetical protein
MDSHFIDAGDPQAAFDLDLTRAAARERRELEAAQHKPGYDGGIERIWLMTAAERVAAMRAGKLSLRQLCAWSALCPDEVPKLPHLGGMEFEWIVVNTPEWCEAREDELARRQREPAAEQPAPVAPRRKRPRADKRRPAIEARWREQAADSTWE